MEETKATLKKRQNFKWFPSHVENLLDGIIQKLNGNPESFEKPTAKLFYKALQEKGYMPGVDWGTIRHKMRYMKSTYIKAMHWKSNTGAGLLEEGDAKGVADYLEKICPFFSSLSQIYGVRKNVNVPVVVCSADDVMSILNDNSESIIDTDILDITPEVVSENVNTESGISFSMPEPTPKKKVAKTSPIVDLLEFQKTKLEFEKEKFEWLKEKEMREMEQQLALKKLQIESEERIRTQELQAQIELKRIEFDEKNKNNAL